VPVARAEAPVRTPYALPPCACAAIGPERNIELDPAYGLIVLAEIAERALSPSVNDPGTCPLVRIRVMHPRILDTNLAVVHDASVVR
jgi:uncharacterized membrane protein